MKKETWFSRNSKALAFFFGIGLMIGAAWLYAFPPHDKSGSDAAGAGFVLPFVIVMALIGLILVFLAFGAKDVALAYFRSQKPKVEEKPDIPPTAG